ncbi:MAG: transporter ATP-binding protein, partial [Thermoleophilia bacterium]|nr:transporter ATP-binding protein [Thermoleophilia bacterium]
METERIEFRDVHRSFTPRGSEPIHAVRGFDAVLRAGETVALLGPNGAGKSTTIDMLLGLLDPDGGTISVFGRTPLEAVDAGLVGAMLQTGSLPRDLTIREIVTLIAATYRTPLAVDEALRRAGITDIAKQRTDSLSGGQTQRVRFAMALVADPSLLVLDEPTVAMDVGSRNDFWQTMRDVASSG